MKFKSIRYILSKILLLEAMFMLLPLIVSFIYRESSWDKLTYVITSGCCGVIGLLLSINTQKSAGLGSKEGLVSVGIGWIIFSLFGSLPYIISGTLPNFFDAFLEACSGFTTTGATVINDFESVTHSIFFYRSLTHFIGGMGVLVFILTILNEKKEQTSIHLLKAESTGPSVGKLTGKMKNTARILYLLYIGLTVLESILLLFDKNVDVFTSICLSMSTISTGGFAVLSSSIGSYSHYVQYIIIIFMFLSGINFSIYFLLINRKFRQVLKNDELKVYTAIVIVSVAIICLNTYKLHANFEETFRTSLFNVVSIMTTTGFAIDDFTGYYPVLSQLILLILMFIGGCAGSTAGGFKVSRLVIVSKDTYNNMVKKASPNTVLTVKSDGNIISDEIINDTKNHFFNYLVILMVATFAICIGNDIDFTTAFSTSMSCISNVGPTIGNIIGSSGNFAILNNFSKFLLSIEMLVGRLELYPILILFSFRTYKRF